MDLMRSSSSHLSMMKRNTSTTIIIHIPFMLQTTNHFSLQMFIQLSLIMRIALPFFYEDHIIILPFGTTPEY